MKTKPIYEGNYLNFFELPNGNLLIKATKEAREEFGKFGKELRNKPEDNALYDLMEDIACNSSWSLVRPEFIGALTSAPIICDDVEFGDDGNEQANGKIWWHEAYQIESTIEKIFKGGCEFQLAKEHE